MKPYSALRMTTFPQSMPKSDRTPKQILTRHAKRFNAEVDWCKSKSKLDIQITAPSGRAWAHSNSPYLSTTTDHEDALEAVEELLDAMQEGYVSPSDEDSEDNEPSWINV